MISVLTVTCAIRSVRMAQLPLAQRFMKSTRYYAPSAWAIMINRPVKLFARLTA